MSLKRFEKTYTKKFPEIKKDLKRKLRIEKEILAKFKKIQELVPRKISALINKKIRLFIDGAPTSGKITGVVGETRLSFKRRNTPSKFLNISELPPISLRKILLGHRYSPKDVNILNFKMALYYLYYGNPRDAKHALH